MLKKHAVRFIHQDNSRTYIVNALGTLDAICCALDLLESDVPAIESAIGLAVVSKAYPEGAHLACEGDGPIIDTTRVPLHVVESELPERVAA
jgi:hypothetical protein